MEITTQTKQWIISDSWEILVEAGNVPHYRSDYQPRPSNVIKNHHGLTGSSPFVGDKARTIELIIYLQTGYRDISRV